MKKIQKLVIALLVISAVMPACKKGADDPFLSLRSRKSRVAGEWKVSTLTDSRNYIKTGSGSSNYNESEVIKVDGANLTVTYTSASSVDVTNGTVSAFTYTFDKDGSWKSVFENSVVTNNPFGSHTVTSKTESSGIWNFLGKIGDAKNKENISVSTTSKTSTTTTVDVLGSGTPSTNVDITQETFANNESVEIWKLTELKNKELKAEIAINNTTTNSPVVTSEIGSTTLTLKQ